MNKLRSLPKLPGNIILRTVYVVGLYPNIPHEESLSALRKRLDNRMEGYISSDTLCNLVEVVLKNNFLKFGEKTLKQKRGTAIGTKFAPPYSILFMAELKEEILRKAEFKPYLWWRYNDDIFFLCEHGEEKLKRFIDNINKMHPSIKFTADWSKTSIHFLDVTLFITEGIIETDLNVKPKDSHQYLLSSSCHPFYCKKGITYSQALRLNKITFNITYHPVFRDVCKILEELHVILASDDGHQKVFPDVPLIGFKNNENLKAHLVRSQSPDLYEVGRSKPCGGKRPLCHSCKILNTYALSKVHT